VKNKPSIFAIITLLVMALAVPAYAQKQSPPPGLVVTAPLSIVPVDAEISAPAASINRASEIKTMQAEATVSAGLLSKKKFILEIVAVIVRRHPGHLRPS
jgi:hypothetical protein